MTTPGPLPLTVIGGYLGAGKTTLLNHLLRANRGRRIAVLVNDFGSINIDAELITHQDGATIQLANGCICCSLAVGFVAALTQVAALAPRPDHVVIEASGVSDPLKIAQYGHVPPFVLDGVVVLADAEAVRARAQDKYVGRSVLRQLRGADLLVLNKGDLVSPEQLAAVRAWLGATAPQATLIEASYGQVDPALLIDLGGHLAGEQPDTDDDDHVAAHESWSFTSRMPLDEARVLAAIAALPPGVVRGKGVLQLRERPERQTVLQLVGRRWALEPGPPWGEAAPGSRLVLIGTPGSLDPAQLAAMLGMGEGSGDAGA